MSLYLTTTTTGHVRAEVSAYLANMASRGAQVQFAIYRPYENGLNHAACEFRASGCDYWLNIDADNPPVGDVMPVVDMGKDFVGFPTPIYRRHASGFTHWNVFSRIIDGWSPVVARGVGMERVDAVGSGCFLVARRVIEAIRKPFERVTDEFGRVTCGVDLHFCELVHAYGFEIWAAWDYPCHHWNEIDLLELTA